MFSVTNTGNLTLTSVGVTDVPNAPAGVVTATCESLSSPAGDCSGATTTLVPGQTALFRGTYVVTQADVNHGTIVDHATTQGTTPTSGTVNATSTPVTVTVTPLPSLAISKSANPTTVTAAGQSVAYTFSVTNTGNLTLTLVGVTDVPTAPAGVVNVTCESLSGPTGDCSGATTTLAPGQTALFTGTYVVTQADVNHGTIVDHATAQGTTPTSSTVNATSTPVTVTVTQSPALTIVKSASPTTLTHAGDTITYTFDVTNSGNVNLTGVGVTDNPQTPAGALTTGPTCQSLANPSGSCSGATTPLAPGQIAVFTGTYVVTQADVDHGSVVDHATTQGTTPSGGTVDATSNTVTVTATPSPTLTIAKSATPTTVTAAGQDVTYTFTVINTGNVTLSSVGVTDVPTSPAGVVTATCQSLSSPTGSCSGATTTLLPGQMATFTGVYVVTEADINHGTIVDHATTQGTTPSSGTVNATSNTVTVTATQSPSLTIAKSATPDTVTAAGQSVTYTLTATNTGNVTLTGVHVTDVPTAPAGGFTATCQSLSNPIGTCSGTTTTLAPGQVANFSATYVVTQADVDNGTIVDHATAHGTPPAGGTTSATSNTVTVTATSSPSLTIAKSATPTTVTAAGQSVTYTFAVENTGNVTLTSVGVTDVPTSPAGGVIATCQTLGSPIGTCSGATTTLLPRQTAVFSGTYTVTQADVDHGEIVDDATVTGTPPSGPQVTNTSNTVKVTATQSASIAIDKSASPTTVTAAGQIVTYTFTVTNTSNVTLTDVGVTDTPTPPAGLVIATCESLADPSDTCTGDTTTLVPGQIALFTGTYTVTQADIDHGKIVDRATATGTPPSGVPVTASSDRDVVVVVTQTESLSIVKSANPTTVSAANQAVAYTFTVTNTGNVTLTDVGVTDNPVSPAGGVTPTCQGLTNPVGTCSGATTTLAPGQIATFGGTYTVTQADIDQGSIVDSATATGTPPSGRDVTANSDIVTVDVIDSPGLALVKSANPTLVMTAGTPVTYTFTVTNSGNETLTNVGVTDVPTAPAGGVSPTCQGLTNPTATCSGATTTLVPGQVATFSAIYTVTQADIDNDTIADSAVAAGTTPSDTSVTQPSNPVAVDVTQAPAIAIAKSATPTTVTAANQPVAYTFTVTNSGNVTLTDVGVTDVPTAPAGIVNATCQGLTNPTASCSGATTTLEPGQVASFAGTYTVTQADIDNDSVVDHATTQGTTPSGGTANGTSNTVTVDVTQTPAIVIAKSASPTAVTAAGQGINYTFTVSNSGNVTLTGVGVTDVPTAPAGIVNATCQGLTNPTATCSGATTTLEPGQVASFTGTYTVTQADIDHDSVVDHATTQGTTPSGGTASDTSNTVTVDVTQSPSLTIVKSVNPTTVTAANQSVTYTFTVTNTGNVDLSDVGVTDVPTAPAGIVNATCQGLTNPTATCSGATTTLEPGQVADFSGTYTVTQADIDHGSVVDHATTQGTTPSGGMSTATSNTITVDVTQLPSLSIAKSADPATVNAANESVTYTFTVTNTGNLTLTDVGVNDVPTAPAGLVIATCVSLSSPTGTCSGATTTLEPGQTAIFTGTYTVTQADIDHGSIADSAIAAGTTPSDTSVTADSNPVTVDVTQSASLSIAKSASPTTITSAGQTIDYTYTVTNTGNLTLTSVGVADVPTAPAGAVTVTCQSLTSPGGTCSGATTTLVPGQVAIFVGTYPVTQADIDQGSIVDHATTQGTTPSGGTPTATSNTVTVDVTQAPSLSISKAANPTTVTAANQTVAYTFTVTNTGNVTITGVGVTDLPTAPAGVVTATCQSLSTPTDTCSGMTTTLVPGQTAVFTGNYTVSQADVDHGSIADTATAQGTPPSGGTISADSSPVTVDVTESPSLSIAKTASPSTVDAAGQTVTYTFTVENTGNSTITDVSVTDVPTAPAGGATPVCQTLVNPSGTCSGNSTSLLPGETAVFTATYTVTQADIDNGSIVDSATTQGTTPTGGTVTNTSNIVTVIVTQTPSLTISKAANPDLVTAAGQIVDYTFVVTNTGNVTLTGVDVTDDPTPPAGVVNATCQGLTNPTGDCSGATTTLVPGQTATFTGAYTVSQLDIDHGSIVDTSTADGTPPSGPDVTAGSNTVNINAPDSPSVSIVKSANLTTVTTAGEGITYTFTVRNSGNEDLHDVEVRDNPVSPAGGVTPICQSLSKPDGTCSGPTTSLAPGQIAIFTATYAVTQADVDHGSITDTATATGTTPQDQPVSGDSNDVTIDVTQTAALSVTKSASPTTVSMVGQIIDYTFTVVNTGNVTLTDVIVTDHPRAPALPVIATCRSLSSPAGTCSGASTTLVPGQTAMFAGTGTVTAADLAHGSIEDTATAQGTSSSSSTTSPPSNPVTIEETDVTVDKSASPSGGVVAGSSTPIVYTVKVANVGTAVTTKPVVVTDGPPPGTTLVSGSPACTGGPPACAVVLTGSTITWTIPTGLPPTISYTLTFSVTANQSQTSGTVTNTATWSGPSCGTSAATTCPTNTTSTPVSPTPTPPTVPTTPATPVASVVAFTGALLTQEWMAALLAAVVGASLLVAARWRRRRPRHAASKR